MQKVVQQSIEPKKMCAVKKTPLVDWFNVAVVCILCSSGKGEGSDQTHLCHIHTAWIYLLQRHHQERAADTSLELWLMIHEGREKRPMQEVRFTRRARGQVGMCGSVWDKISIHNVEEERRASPTICHVF